jgi:hypothetical protein
MKTILEFWEQHRPRKHDTAPVDKLRYTTLQQCLENFWNFIDEQHPRSGKSEANNLYGGTHRKRRSSNFA